MPVFRKRKDEPPSVIVGEPPGTVRESIWVNAGPVRLPGDLLVPAGSFGIVAFAHGSGSGRRSPRNVEVAARLNQSGMGTLLFDLLTPAEGEDRANVFDIELLAERLVAAEKWLRTRPGLGNLPIGLFGASTGAAAALVAAARSRGDVAAVVSRGGRPDLAGEALARVTAPTLFIVGGDDVGVLALNREAEQKLRCEKRLDVVSGATHLFEEPGALEEVSRLAAEWFAKHLAEAGHGRRMTVSGQLG